MSPVGLVGTVRALGAIERAMSAGGRVLRDAAHGVLSAALDDEERHALGVALYEGSLDRARTGLPPWEREWLAADLPQPPSRVLVGACGSGREALALAEAGHHVGAFDPGPRAVAACALSLGARGVVARATYEDLAAWVLDAAEPASRGLADVEWDAILLGWTSVMHVIDDRDRSRLMLACDRLAPSGPILLTFYPSERARRRGRAHRAARSLGERIGRARGVAPAPLDAWFGFTCGFLRGWTSEELHARAADVGREVVWRGDDEGCVRATLRRRRT